MAKEAVPNEPRRLGYLLKHAQKRYGEMTSEALAPLGLDGRSWAALNCLDEQHGHSQREVAELLAVDRTTMVALVDGLQGAGLVERRPHRDDRRKNTVVLTDKGRDSRRRGARLIDDCESRFLRGLDKSDAARFRSALEAVITAEVDAPGDTSD